MPVNDKTVLVLVSSYPYAINWAEKHVEGILYTSHAGPELGHAVAEVDKWQPGMGIVDFTNPEACEWYKGHLEKLIHMGVDSFKTDFGERIPTDVIIDTDRKRGGILNGNR